MKKKKIIAIILALVVAMVMPLTAYAVDNQIQPRYSQIVRASASISESGTSILGSCSILTNGNYNLQVRLYLQLSDTGNSNDWTTYGSYQVTVNCNSSASVEKPFANVPESNYYRIKANITVLGVSSPDNVTVYSRNL